jgi:hypothetical protein
MKYVLLLSDSESVPYSRSALEHAIQEGKVRRETLGRESHTRLWKPLAELLQRQPTHESDPKLQTPRHYVIWRGNESPPLSRSELEHKVRKGELPLSSLARQADSNDWKPLFEFLPKKQASEIEPKSAQRNESVKRLFLVAYQRLRGYFSNLVRRIHSLSSIFRTLLGKSIPVRWFITAAAIIAIFVVGLKIGAKTEKHRRIRRITTKSLSNPPAPNSIKVEPTPVLDRSPENVSISMPQVSSVQANPVQQFPLPSAIREDVNAQEKTLTKQLSDQQKTESAAREQAKKKELEQAAQKKPQWLAAWKSKLIEDLNQRHFAGAIVDLSGVQYTGIESATPDKLSMKLPYGTMLIDWAKFSPKTLLAISTSFIQPNAVAAADRQWLCAVYASETGQADAARQLAEAAAKSKPEYRDLILLLVKQVALNRPQPMPILQHPSLAASPKKTITEELDLSILTNLIDAPYNRVNKVLGPFESHGRGNETLDDGTFVLIRNMSRSSHAEDFNFVYSQLKMIIIYRPNAFEDSELQPFFSTQFKNSLRWTQTKKNHYIRADGKVHFVWGNSVSGQDRPFLCIYSSSAPIALLDTYYFAASLR